MPDKDIAIFTPQSSDDWRNWLEQNHLEAESVWLVYFKKHTGLATVSWSETVDEALCFGWIDSLVKPIDDRQFMRLFTRRKPRSVWSQINKRKVEVLIASDRMAKAGLAAIDIAKANGYWESLDEVNQLLLPADLQQALQQNTDANEYVHQLSNSDKRSMLQWLMLARRTDTRMRRIAEIVDCANQRMKPKAIAWVKK